MTTLTSGPSIALLPDGTELHHVWTSRSGQAEMSLYADLPNEAHLLLGGDQDEADADLDEYLTWARSHDYPCDMIKFHCVDQDGEYVTAYRDRPAAAR